MEHAQATLLLTRPSAQSQAFLADCEGILRRRIPAVISPVIEVEPIGDLPALDDFTTLVITSGNGVRCLEHALAGRKVATVGAKTAELARRFGADAVALGETVTEFVTRARELEGPALYCRGVHTRGQLAEQLVAAGLSVSEALLYDQVSQPLTQAARALLTGEGRVVAPVFSPRSAALLSANVITAPLTVIAMSEAVRDAWQNSGDVQIAAKPTAAAMCMKIAEAF